MGIGRYEPCKERVHSNHHQQERFDALGAPGTQFRPCPKSLAPWLDYGRGLSFVKMSSMLGQLSAMLTAGALASAVQSTGHAFTPERQEIIANVHGARSMTANKTG